MPVVWLWSPSARVLHSLSCQWCGQRSKVFLASKDTSERSLEPRDCGALRGALGPRGRVKTRSGGPREQPPPPQVMMMVFGDMIYYIIMMMILGKVTVPRFDSVGNNRSLYELGTKQQSGGTRWRPGRQHVNRRDYDNALHPRCFRLEHWYGLEQDRAKG